MPGHSEEKERCLEKLQEMQKFLPFLDFMIEKIKKKNNEISLECQLSKFQLLRSMIAEKNGKYSWDIILKVEDVIQKLITKLDYKEQNYPHGLRQKENTREKTKSKDCQSSSKTSDEAENKIKMAAAVSMIPSSTTATISITSALSSAQVTTVDSRPQDSSTNTVDLIMKTLKISVENKNKNNDEGKEVLSSSTEDKSRMEYSDKMETDLDKDLDGFDLPDCTSFAEETKSQSRDVPEKVKTPEELLSSSTEKLLKSLQKKLNSSKTDRNTSEANKPGKSHTASAFSNIYTFEPNENKTKSDVVVTESSESAYGKPAEQDKSKFYLPPPKSFYLDMLSDKKSPSEPKNSSGDYNSKQKLREKLSADICEVYRVSGKSVGGSLRSLKDHKRSSVTEEDDLFKPDKVTEVRGSKSAEKPHRSTSGKTDKKGQKTNEKKTSQRRNTDDSGKRDKKKGVKEDDKVTKEKKSGKDEKSSDKTNKNDLESLSDDELIEFVKENMQSLPHLSKLKPMELRKAVSSSLSFNTGLSDTEAVSEDSFQDLDEFMNEENVLENNSKGAQDNPKSQGDDDKPHPFACIKISEIGSDGVAKNVKPIIEPSRDTKILEAIGDKTHEDAETVEEEDFAQKLIEETTPQKFPTKKKKGLLELPLPWSDDLFDNVSPEDTSTASPPPSDIRDPRRKKNSFASGNQNSPTCSRFDRAPNVDPSRPPNEVWPASNIPYNPPVSKDSMYVSKPPRHFIPPNHPGDNFTGRLPRNSRGPEGSFMEEKNEPWHLKPIHIPQDTGQIPYRYPINPVRNPGPFPGKFSMYNPDPSWHNQYYTSEPKSYAEYKRMKQKEQERLNQQEAQKEKAKETVESVNTENSTTVDTEDPEGKSSESRPPRQGDSYGSQKNPRSQAVNTPRPNTTNTKGKTDKRRYPEHTESRSAEGFRGGRKNQEETKKEEEERKKKVGGERRNSAEPDELVSPLEKLYQNENKPKTGRGYGLQNFKIPKKIREPISPKKSSESPTPKEVNSSGKDEQSQVSSTECEVTDSEVDKNSDSITKPPEVSDNPNKTETSEANEKTSVQVDEGSEPKTVLPDSADSVTEVKTDTKDSSEVEEAKSDSNKANVVDQTEISNSKNEIEQVSTNTGSETVASNEGIKKCEAEIVECDSSVESANLSSQAENKESGSASDKSQVYSKEEITQEFVEALIRKSFQSGEGKLLLAQAKLFEELARKLNSKKLKTIQKIINSESESSSSSTETSSEEEKKKKSRRSEDSSVERSSKKKRKKKMRKSRILKISSSSESEESNDEETPDKKEEEKNKKDETEKQDSEASLKENQESKTLPVEKSNVEDDSKSCDSPSIGATPKPNAKPKTKRRKAMDFGRCFSRKKTRRRQGQKKLLEEMLSESPIPEQRVDSPGPDKETEPKSKPRQKAKAKTELDRLHDDIRSMFISSGVVTATGQRMCRILRESGGNMNNVDIVKESAKMVEEEKLRKGQTRSSYRNSRNQTSRETRSRSQSSDKLSSRDRSKSRTRTESQQENNANDPDYDEDKDSKLHSEIYKNQPFVLLQRVDLDNFGYGVKISDNCISFSRLRGGNTALRRKSCNGSNKYDSSETLGVYLARNKRKCERMKNKKVKKGYVGKKLMDIVQKLPLKIAKMKHLELCDRKIENDVKKGKAAASKAIVPKTKNKSLVDRKTDLRFGNLVNYAFERKRLIYPCRLCPHMTKNITSHYITMHPGSEVLISRLGKMEAKKAIEDSKENGYDLTDQGGACSLEMLKRRVKSKMSLAEGYLCRMCNSPRIGDINSFFSHVSSHTGEYRFKCPRGGCGVAMSTRENIKFHIFSKHPKERIALTWKITELFAVPSEGNFLFGFICTECNFVQISRENVENHVRKNHSPSKKTMIVKIDMSRKEADKIPGTKKPRKSKKIVEDDDFDVDVEGLEASGDEVRRSTRKTAASEDLSRTAGKRKLRPKILRDDSDDSADQNARDEDLDSPKSKKSNLDLEISKKADELKCDEDLEELSQGSVAEDSVYSGDENEGADDDEAEEKVDVNDCMDLKNISAIKAGDIIISIEVQDKKPPEPLSGEMLADAPESMRGCIKLKVGPLEAQILENSDVLYECYVKGCLFSTRVYDLFEKHIKISHSAIKWNGVCEICGDKSEKNSCPKFLKLVSALKHLKQHETEKIAERKMKDNELNSVEADEDLDLNTEIEPICEITEEPTKEEKKENPFPVKPLLRVRNLLGDRLSTPKDSTEDDDVVAITENQPSSETKIETPMMFTIENVRSLKSEESEDSQQLKQLLQNPKMGKPIVVRSCPTRKIAIRPESIGIPVKVVHAPIAGTTMLSPVPNNAPIRIISTMPSSKFPLDANKVSTSPAFLTSLKMVSVIRPLASPTVTKAVMPATIQTPAILSPPAENPPVENPPVVCQTVAKPPETPKPKTAKRRTTVYRPSPTPAVLPEPVGSEPKKKSDLQKMCFNPTVGNKSVKDAKIYQEMLTKAKLCHLFKCMAVECSFTCNVESVFTQHIGLHEAQCRMKNQRKSMKTVYLYNSYRSKKVYNWQQCAYCCEVLLTTGSALGQHIRTEHGHCIYQCAYCFYRAVSQSYVEIHQNLAHSKTLKTSARKIYKCKPLSPTPSQASALEKQGRRQSVRPYHCDQCGSKFFITQEFMNHLTTEHQGVTAYTCHICKNLCFKADRLIVHYKLHSYCTYQCAYCLHGTETEKEMVFHLCNFHFSHPACMYVRALAEGQSEGAPKKLGKKKKSNSSQLDSLKVVVYDSENLTADCVEEVEEDSPTDATATTPSLDLSAIVAELGINTDSKSPPPLTPIIKELASIGKQNQSDLSVETLLPNAQFSSENDPKNESCSLLISSKLSMSSGREKDMNTPLGQLSINTVTVKTGETAPPPPSTSPDKNLKLNLLKIMNEKEKLALQNKEANKEETATPAVHKMPAVVLSRRCSPKKVYSAKTLNRLKRKPEESSLNEEGQNNLQIINVDDKSQDKEESESEKIENTEETEQTETENVSQSVEKVEEPEKTEMGQPLITNVVSLSKDEGPAPVEEPDNESIIISDICSLSYSTIQNPIFPNAPGKIVINIQSKVNIPTLKPPIIRVEDFHISESETDKQEQNVEETKVECSSENKPEEAETKEKADEAAEGSPSSPDVIILEEEKTENEILTVTLDSEDEKEPETDPKTESPAEEDTPAKEQTDDTIRKEMELLRNQIANETDCLLFDDTETGKAPTQAPSTPEPKRDTESPKVLSPIEEAICTLNKELQSENVKEDEEKKKSEDDVVPDLPRTRSGVRDKGKKDENVETFEKSDSEDSNMTSSTSDGKKDDGKTKRFKDDLFGKDLYICGNERCNFAVEADYLLKEHLYVCDLSRESSVFVCPHCSKQIKHFNPYIEHIKHHGEKKYHCGLCDFSSAVENSTTRHMKLKHKCYQIKSVPKDPPNERHIVYYPKNHKIEKQDFELNGYSPGDEDKLPLQSVYQVNVKCAKCPYFTKVRSNMVRHLKIHLKSVETEGGVVVPSTAPTNPVPCLDTKEKMFDKMTNLAASSQLAQAKEKTAIEALSPEEKAKLPEFVAEQMRYKCCLPDCNYITVDDGMLKHHIKALHDEISYYSCPHCQTTVHVDVRNVTLDKIGHHLKHHDTKLYKCAHCIYFHYQKNVVEKHTTEKHPDRRYFVHTVREPKTETPSEEETPPVEPPAKVWKCGLCEDFQSPSRASITDHLAKKHNTKAKYKCQICCMKTNHYQAFFSHFSSKHVGEKVAYVRTVQKVNANGTEPQSGSSGPESSSEHFDTTPLWQRGAPRVRHIRGILIEEEEVRTKKSKRMSEDNESEPEIPEGVSTNNSFYCPLCSNKKKPFFTKNAEYFRSHLYQELNYNQYACILCGKMFVDKKEFDKHHTRLHPDKPPSLKQTKEDGEIKFWVDKVIARQQDQMQNKKRRLSEDDSNDRQTCPKKKKEG